MYKKNSDFEELDGNIKIWRYIDSTKFVSLLDTKQLFFARADKFNDPFEGSYTKVTKSMREKFFEENNLKVIEEQLSNVNKLLPRHTLINCWHINDWESAAMWNLYANENRGIALQSSFDKLRKCFSLTSENVTIAKINYIDYNTHIFPINKPFFPFFCKRKSFEHEKELRALILKFPSKKKSNDVVDLESPLFDIGMYIDIDVKELVENIYVCPTAPEWFVELVKNVIKNYGFNFNVINSELNKEPIW